MSHRRAVRLAPLLAALIVTACGGSGAPDAPEPDKSAPAPSGGLRVGATDLRLGDATEADATGLRELRVQRRVDPDALQRRGRNRDGVSAGASCADVDVLPDGSNTAVVIESALCLLNGERADAGLAPLSHNDRLAASAVAHSRDMVDNQYFAHLALDGSDVVDRVRAAGYLPDGMRWTVGENLAWGTGTLSTPRNIVAAWMESSGHRANILRGAFREIGFGVVTGNPRSRDGQGATYTTNFGFVEGSGPAPGSGPESGTTAPETTAATQPASTTKKSGARKKARKSRARRRARRARNAARRAHARAIRAAAVRS